MATTCAKCGAELIGLKKFCATCGAPAVDPKSVAAPAAPPPADPYASTALADKLQKMQAEYGPPPPVSSRQLIPQGPPSSPSGALPAPISSQPVPPAQPSSQPSVDPTGRSRTGTVAMPSVPMPSNAPLSPLATSNIQPSAPAVAAPPAPMRHPTPPMGVPAQRSGLLQTPSTPQNVPLQPLQTPQSVPVQRPPTPQPISPQQAQQAQHGFNMYGSQVQRAPASAYGAQPAQQPYPGGQPLPQPPPPAPAPAPPPAAAPPAPVFGAGALVYVTWADGNRYPGTIQQVSGSQYLVVFNDGRQQWVEARFVSVGM